MIFMTTSNNALSTKMYVCPLNICMYIRNCIRFPKNAVICGEDVNLLYLTRKTHNWQKDAVLPEILR